jgi:hypothetical protein
VKALIADMIQKLEHEAEADATTKAYCDKELSETKAKQTDKNTEIEKYSTSIDGMSARSVQLKGGVGILSKACYGKKRANYGFHLSAPCIILLGSLHSRTHGSFSVVSQD